MVDRNVFVDAMLDLDRLSSGGREEEGGSRLGAGKGIQKKKKGRLRGEAKSKLTRASFLTKRMEHEA